MEKPESLKLNVLKRANSKLARPRIRRATGRVTLADVARIAAVSSQTVSRVLNAPDKVPPETLTHVRAAIAQAGYLGASAIGNAAAQRSKLVAVLVPTISGAVFAETIEALNKTLARNGYQMMLGESGYQDEDEDALLDNLIQRRPDGIVLTRIVRSEAARERLRKSRIAVVETWDLTPSPIDMLIGFSHAEVGTEVARYFQRQGRRFPGLIIGDDPRATRRGEAFLRAIDALHMRHSGFKKVPVVKVPAPASLGAGRSGLTQLLEQCPKLDAVFCSTDMVGLGVLIEAKSRGLRVPQDLAVMGFGDLAFAQQTDPPLSTVRVDGTTIGQRAAQYIMSRAEGWPIVQPVVDIGFSLIRRESS
jgi:LacI family transcriptional regulator, gluconate utilization system Gnt-I transcriptional repressor